MHKQRRPFLRRELCGVILFKLIFIGLLWLLCFSHPSQSSLHRHQLFNHLMATPVNLRGQS